MIGFLIAGLIVGALARLLVPGRQKIGLLLTLLLGVIGSVVGGTIANALNTGDVFELNFIGFVAAVVSSVALLTVAETAGLGDGGRGKRRDLPRGR
ncbi:MAG TPA: GlsB/YeaQ/YmgE family stress response membrane protein [Thermoleophilaceae bacterium]|nr:GlsB/YeaQ/YmgE family stress response membrane protein [Thermoleophilaceae bacterium]